MKIFQTKLQDSRLMNYSLSDMVREIVKKPTIFEGRSYIIINKIKKVNNNSSDGGKKINEAWEIAKNGSKEAQRKTNKYFMEGTKASKNYFSLPTEKTISTQEIKTEQGKDTLDKVVTRKVCDDDLSNHSIKKLRQ